MEEEHEGLTPDEIKFKEQSKMRNIMIENFNTMVRYQKSIQGPGINKISEITPHLLLSNYDASLDFVNLKENGINFILYFGTKERDQTLLNRYKNKDIETRQIQLPDVENNQNPPNVQSYLDPVYNILHSLVLDEKKILLCCDRGVSLSVCFLMYYFLKRYYLINIEKNKNALMNIKNVFITDILKFIKDIRVCIDVHPGFLQQLVMIEMNYKNKS